MSSMQKSFGGARYVGLQYEKALLQAHDSHSYIPCIYKAIQVAL